MISELLERLFPRSGPDNSRLEVKRRLKLVLAYDRADITPDTFEAMRQEILEVVCRYVELDPEGFNLSLENSDRATALIANFPIRRMKKQPGSDDEFDSNALNRDSTSEPKIESDLESDSEAKPELKLQLGLEQPEKPPIAENTAEAEAESEKETE